MLHKCIDIIFDVLSEILNYKQLNESSLHEDNPESLCYTTFKQRLFNTNFNFFSSFTII